MSSWTPHSYQREGESRAYSAEFLAILREEGNRLRARKLPVLFTLGHLAAICEVPYVFLTDVIRRRRDEYRVFPLRKRSGGYRMIAVPDSKLLRVQRWIHQEILLHQQNHQISTAFAPGCAPMLNAERHCGARWLVKVDISNFFEAISERQVYYVFREIGYPRLLSFQLTRLCTRIAEGSRKYRQKRWHTEGAGYKVFSQPLIGHLPQGAPTSPIISNLVCRRLDELLVAMASEYNCIVTRYADDIVFSGAVLGRDMAIALIEKVSALLGGFGFSRNRRKTQIVPPGARRVVTGLLVDSSKPRLTRKFKDNLRLQLYHAWTKGIHEHCLRRKFRSIIGFREHLHGLITYAELIDPVFGARCREKFVSLPWEQFELLSYD